MPLTDKHIKPKLTEKQQNKAFAWWCNKNEEELNVHFETKGIKDTGLMTIVAKGLWLEGLEKLGLKGCNS